MDPGFKHTDDGEHTTDDGHQTGKVVVPATGGHPVGDSDWGQVVREFSFRHLVIAIVGNLAGLEDLIRPAAEVGTALGVPRIDGRIVEISCDDLEVVMGGLVHILRYVNIAVHWPGSIIEADRRHRVAPLDRVVDRRIAKA